MRAIKGNPALAGQYAQLEARYRELSNTLGGDDPAAAIGGRAATSGAGLHVRGGGPPLPPNCTGASNTFTNNTPVPIIDLGTVNSTIAVAGAGTIIFDVDVTTNITHTFASDLDFTLASPGGTVVTLSTDNGGGNDNVYNGTVWNDDANPGGQVPYATNPGLVTDHVYANLVLASPLVPEEALAAFFGENPNGTWTLTVSDDVGADVGTINSWSITITTLDAAPLTTAASFPSTDTPIPIIDLGTITSTLAVTSPDTFLCDVNVTTNITHTFAADLDFTLAAPSGTVMTFSTDNGAGSDNVYNGTLWDDDANPLGQVPYATNNGLATDHVYANLVTATPLVPEEALGAFIGDNPNGNWLVTISDDLGADVGTLASWTLDLTTCTCQQPDADLEISKTGAVAGSQIVWTLQVTNNGPANATGVVVTDPLDACTVYVSDDCGGANVPPWTWNIGALAASASVTCNVTVDASGCAGTVSNTATVSGAQNDPVPANNTGTFGIVVGTAPAIPTLGGIGLALLLLVLAGSAVVLLRRRAA
jgi:uncharacterized repeat protein (TIGR01451 family)